LEIDQGKPTKINRKIKNPAAHPFTTGRKKQGSQLAPLEAFSFVFGSLFLRALEWSVA
jgi:hypothetical protein